MSILIDKLVKQQHKYQELNLSWYIEKTKPKQKFIDRLKDAMNVLSGNAFAVHYFEDEANTWGEVV